jgi:N-methylhydantoinase B
LAVMETPGAGGYGPPADRSKTSLKEDLDSGKFSVAFVEKNYKM